jgi:hypothetical protein
VRLESGGMASRTILLAAPTAHGNCSFWTASALSELEQQFPTIAIRQSQIAEQKIKFSIFSAANLQGLLHALCERWAMSQHL